MFNETKDGVKVQAGGIIKLDAPNGVGQVLYLEKLSGAGTYPVMVYSDATKTRAIMRCSGPGIHTFSESFASIVLDFTPGGGGEGDVWAASVGALGDSKPNPKSALPEGWVQKASSVVTGTGASNLGTTSADVRGADKVLVVVSEFNKPATGAFAGCALGFELRENGSLGQSFFRQWQALNNFNQNPYGIDPATDLPIGGTPPDLTAIKNVVATVFIGGGITEYQRIPSDLDTEGAQSGAIFQLGWPIVGPLEVRCYAMSIDNAASAWTARVDVFARY